MTLPQLGILKVFPRRLLLTGKALSLLGIFLLFATICAEPSPYLSEYCTTAAILPLLLGIHFLIDAPIPPLMCSGRFMLCHESPLKQHSVNFLQCCAIPMLQCERTRHWHLPSVRPLMVPGSYRSFSHLLCSLAAWFVWVHARGSASSESHLCLLACTLIPCP